MNLVTGSTTTRTEIIGTDAPEVRRLVTTLNMQLIEQAGLAFTVAVAFAMLADLMVIVLHTDSPMPEVNVATLKELAATLNQCIDDHTDCALNIRQRIAEIEAEQKGEATPEPQKPQVH